CAARALWPRLGSPLLPLPSGTATFSIVVAFWSLGLGLLFSPLFALGLDRPIHIFDAWINVTIDNSPLLVQVTDTNGHHLILDTPIEFALVALAGLLIL